MNTNRSLVTPDAITSAVNAIEGRGERVSVRAVREELGGGSLTKILDTMRNIRPEGTSGETILEAAQSGPVEVTDPDGLLPKDLLRKIEEAMGSLAAVVPAMRSAMAQTLAAERTNSALAERAEAEEAVAEIDRMRDEMGSLRSKLDGATEMTINLKRQLSAAQDRIIERDAEVGRVTKALDEMTKALNEKAGHIDRLAKDLKDADAEAQKWEKAHSEAKQEIWNLKAEYQNKTAALRSAAAKPENTTKPTKPRAKKQTAPAKAQVQMDIEDVTKQ